MLVAVVLVLLVLFSLVFHFASPWWFTELASNWGSIDDTVTITFWVTGIVFVAVNLFMAYAVIKYRHRKEERAHYEPENTKLEVWLTVITTIGVAAMLAPGLYVWGQFVTVPEEAWVFEAVGEQWRWSFRLPGNDGELGTTDARLINPDNPFGMNPKDPKGMDDILVNGNEMHIPVDKPVKVLLRSKDVLHDFAVPQFRVKMDLVPGLVSYLWFTPTRTGTFDILCEELCGVAHFTMRNRIVVDSQSDFESWQSKQMTYAQSGRVEKGNVQAGRSLYQVCSACHGQQGEGNVALNSPKISGQEDWYVVRQLQNYKHGVRGAHQDDMYGKQMAPMAAFLADDAAMRNVAAYISTLPNKSSATTIEGDIENGKQLYITCGNCHGVQGQGNYATNSPRLNDQEDWYLIRQLHNFKGGIRGVHREDLFGPQMASMAGILKNEQEINDVVAYINTLQGEK